MTLRSIRHGAVLQCQCPGCPEKFVSYSTRSIVRAQAKLAGWDRVKAKYITTQDQPWRLYDVCRVHAIIAAEAKAREPAERALKKAQRATERVAREAAAAADKLERKQKREAKRAAKQAKKAARAAAREAKLAAKFAAEKAATT